MNEADSKCNIPPENDWDELRKQRIIYLEDLRKWIESAREWNNLSSDFLQYSAGSRIQDTFSGNLNQNAFASFYQNQSNEGLRQRNNQQGHGDNATVNGIPFYQTYPFIFPPNLLRPPTTYEFIIPPLWKRLCAELIDFCILFIFKLVLTFLFMDFINLGTLDHYGLEAIRKSFEGSEIAFPLAIELLSLELIHRFVVCAFETYFTKGKMCSTPGKHCMGLMVVNVETLTLVPNRQTETVSATGVKALGWQKAMLRSSLKNIMVGLLLPLCITFYLFPFNRTSYDMMSNSLVVEMHPEFLMYQNLIAT
ncbi:protein FAM8A1 isoform X2 [Rhynchophorus ferrugineus]|uniref:protein FAM8A1 isoform X2 n=1 Tax=Rhynchophorus ferrugineus TaxID=354439 RepID=UPI003FCCAD46